MRTAQPTPTIQTPPCDTCQSEADGRVVSMAEMLKIPAPTETRWGPWEWRPQLLVLEYVGKGIFHGRQVDLEHCTNGQVLKWIAWALGKVFTPSDLGHLLRALNAVAGIRNTLDLAANPTWREKRLRATASLRGGDHD